MNSIKKTGILMLMALGLLLNSNKVNAKTYSVEYSLSDKYVEFSPTKDVVYTLDHQIPITEKGNVYGFSKIVSVDKLGYSDWSNKAVKDNSIKHSYVVVMEIDISEYKNFEALDIEAYPRLVYKGKEVSSLGVSGWSGLGRFTTVYKNSTKGIVEVIVQPTAKKFDTVEIDISANDIVFDTIVISKDELGTADTKNRTLDYDKPIVYTLKDGSKFAITITGTSINNIESRRDNQVLLDIDYKVKRLALPTNSKDTNLVLPNFTATLSNGLVYTDKNLEAERLIYSDSNSKEEYTYTPNKVKLGSTVYGTTNIILGEELPNNNGYVRISLDFSTLINKFSLNELLSFNVRHNYYEVLIGELELKSRKESK